MSDLEKYGIEDITPKGMLGQDRIVGIVNFRDMVIVATEYHVYRMSHDSFDEIQFELVKNK